MRGETPVTTFALSSLKMALDKPYSGGDRNVPVLLALIGLDRTGLEVDTV